MTKRDEKNGGDWGVGEERKKKEDGGKINF